VGVAGAAALLLITLGVRSDVARSPEQSLPVSEVVDEVALTPAGTQLVGSALAGSSGGSPTVSSEPCDGAVLPLSLPAGATPIGAALVQGAPSTDGPIVVGTEAADDFEAVEDGSTTTLVSDGGACLSSQVIAAMADAPDDTALVVSFIDQLGNLQILVVPQIVEVVGDALQAATELVASTPLAQYLNALADALGQLPGDLSSLPGTGGTGTGTGDLSGVLDPPSVDVPDLPAIPPPTGGDDGGGDDVLPTVPTLPPPTIPTLPTLPGLP
jgi:hypothetical protein